MRTRSMTSHHVVHARVSLHVAPVPGNLQPRSQSLSSSRPVSRYCTGRDGTKRDPGNDMILLLVLALGHVLPEVVFGHSRWHLYTIITLLTRLKLHISLKALLARNGLSCVDVCVVSCHLMSYIQLKLHLPSGLCFLPKHWLKPMKRQISKRVACILALVFFLPRT